jgi:hypothetical protein
MGRFTKLRKNKKYNYSPRYYDDKGEGNPFRIQRKLDKFRSTAETPRGLKGKFSSAMADRHKAGDKNHSIRLLVILAVLILLVLYVFDFDLSIFFNN